MSRAIGVALGVSLLLGGGRAGAQTVGVEQRTLLQVSGGHALPGAGEGASVVREVRGIRLPPGRRTVTWSGLAEPTVLETLQVALTGARLVGVRVQESAYAAGSLSALLRGAEVVARDARPLRPGHRPGPTTRGTLISLDEGVVLRTGRELTVLGPSHLHGGPPPARTLEVDLEVTGAGEQEVAIEVTALVGKVVQHPPRYTLRLEPGAERASLDGSVTFTNLSGLPLDGARAALARGTAVTPPGATFALGASWAAAPFTGQPDLFPVAEPLRFGPTLAAEAALIHAASLPVAQRTQVTPYVIGMFERAAETIELRPVRVTSVDTRSAGIGLPLPRGAATIWATPDPARPAVLHGPGQLEQAEAGPVEITTPSPVRAVEGRVKAAQRIGPCRGRAVWVFTVPDEAMEGGSFDLVLSGSRKAIAVKLLGKGPGQVHVEDQRTVVRLPRRAPGAPKPPPDGPGQKLEVELRMNACL